MSGLSAAFNVPIISTTNARAEALAYDGNVLYAATDIHGGRRVHRVGPDSAWPLREDSPFWVTSLRSTPHFSMVGEDDHVVRTGPARTVNIHRFPIPGGIALFRSGTSGNGHLSVLQSHKEVYSFHGRFLGPPVVKGHQIAWICAEWPAVAVHVHDIRHAHHQSALVRRGTLSSLAWADECVACWESPVDRPRLVFGEDPLSLVQFIAHHIEGDGSSAGTVTTCDLDGVLCYEALATRQPRGTVLFLHGGPHSRALPVFSPVHTMVMELGYRLVLVNVRGSTIGPSVTRDIEYGVDDAADVARVATAFRRLGPVSILGWSYGGYLGARALALGIEVDSLVGVSTFFCGEDLFHAQDLGVQRFAAAVRLPSALSGALERTKILLIHGALDRRVPFDAMAAYAPRRNISFVPLDNEEHGVATDAGAVIAYGAIRDWLSGRGPEP